MFAESTKKMRNDDLYSWRYYPSNGTIATVLLRDLDPHFQIHFSVKRLLLNCTEKANIPDRFASTHMDPTWSCSC